MQFDFVKMNGLGNDFVIIESALLNFSTKDVVGICDRRRGIGCDQLILTSVMSGDADIKMHIYNSDGTTAEMCGNAVRCVAKLAAERLGRNIVMVLSGDRLLECTVQESGLVIANMGEPLMQWHQIPMLEECNTQNVFIDIPGLPGSGFAVNFGNPHVVFFVDDVDSIDLHSLGRQVECHTMFPRRTNVEFVSITNDSELTVRVWERGVGETRACGSGSCAVFVAASKLGLIKAAEPIKVIFPGGVLWLSWHGNSVLMAGDANVNFVGHYSC